MGPTIKDIFDTLTENQKQRVYELVGYAVEKPEIAKSEDFDLSFLSNSFQELAVKAIIEQALFISSSFKQEEQRSMTMKDKRTRKKQYVD